MSKRTLAPAEEVRTSQLEDDEFAAEWDRTALARAVALEVVRYRADNGLSRGAVARPLCAIASACQAARRRFGAVGADWCLANRVVGGHLLTTNTDPPWLAS